MVIGAYGKRQELRRFTLALTIGETIKQLHRALRDYIEATYHVSHPYARGPAPPRSSTNSASSTSAHTWRARPATRPGNSSADLGLDPAALEIFTSVSAPRAISRLLIHDPPYQHQALSTQLSLVDGRSLVVMTGTGSGKTECFLLPILGKLATEAKTKARASDRRPPSARWCSTR